MKQNVYAIHDVKADAFLQPFFLPTDGVAVRAIVDCLDDPNHNFAAHPSDYTLFKIGEFDNSIGEFTELCKKSLGNLVEFLAHKPVIKDGDL